MGKKLSLGCKKCLLSTARLLDGKRGKFLIRLSHLFKSSPDCAFTEQRMHFTLRPYLNDVYTIFGIFDPLPPCLHFGKIHKTKSTQPPLLRPLVG